MNWRNLTITLVYDYLKLLADQLYGSRLVIKKRINNQPHAVQLKYKGKYLVDIFIERQAEKLTLTVYDRQNHLTPDSLEDLSETIRIKLAELGLDLQVSAVKLFTC